MLLGKRPRPPIKRTTSMTSITVDLSGGEAPEPSDPHQNSTNHQQNDASIFATKQSFMAMLSPRNHPRSSADFIETAHFLRTCGLCKRNLVSGRDIYMYMGDTAFCSLECREQQMKQDERKEKCMAASRNDDVRHHKTSSSATSSKASTAGKSQTVAAA